MTVLIAADHAREQTEQQEPAKGRLCAASGLPLVRIDDAIDDTFLHRLERVSLVAWLATRWAALPHLAEALGAPSAASTGWCRPR